MVTKSKKTIPFGNNITSPLIQNFIASFSFEYYERADREFLRDCRELLTKDPISKFCCEIIFLYLFSILDRYSHSSSRITKDIEHNINNCRGSWHETLKRIASAYWYGYSWSEVAVTDTPTNRKLLTDIHTYDPFDYDFVIKNNKIEHVYYHGRGLSPIKIPYGSGIHFVTGVDCSFDYIFGCGRVESALPYWELHKLMMPVIALAGQRQATPILVKRTDTGEDVLLINQETGLPEINQVTGEEIVVKKGWDSVKQLEALGAAGVTAIDREDDIYGISLKISDKFLLDIVKVAEQYRMISFIIPVTLFSVTNTGLGNAGVATSHLEVFRFMVRSMAEFLSEEIVEKLFRPLIIYNFGEQADYGTFIINENNPLALQIAELAINAVSKGKPELSDIAMFNHIRELLGVPPYEEILK